MPIRRRVAFDEGSLFSWLLDAALPLWARHGVDREGGGFFEQLTPSLAPVEQPRRARLVARQVFCFSAARELGWDGPVDEIVHHGLTFLLGRLVGENGTVLIATEVAGNRVVPGHDLYDYAFVIFGLAAARRILPDRSDLEAVAMRVMNRLVRGWAHPVAGFEESVPRTLPLKANPHMHLFEACLAWAEIGTAEASFWLSWADHLARLALDRLIDWRTGALPEFFDANWRPQRIGGSLRIEPGHQFEWASLLSRWVRLGGGRRCATTIERLVAVGERGVRSHDQVVANVMDDQMRIIDPAGRLWPQTERLKAWHLLAAEHGQGEPAQVHAEQQLERTLVSLSGFLRRAPHGLWFDEMSGSGEYLDLAVRASSLYHLVAAAKELRLPRRKVGREPALEGRPC